LGEFDGIAAAIHSRICPTNPRCLVIGRERRTPLGFGKSALVGDSSGVTLLSYRKVRNGRKFEHNEPRVCRT
jgi:hypothetical protein